ncbi:histone deacetylase [Rosistilla oblonga]|uniref:histone deacetylase family protein n=1 Tax=Rosistilla oblonga TaxID=2527990 RepID=UPI003A96F5F3
MTILYYDPIFMEHLTGDHPERGGRILPAVRNLSFLALDSACKRPAWESVSKDRLFYVHQHKYIEALQQMAETGGGLIDTDTVISPKSYEVALKATGAVCDAVCRVVAGEDKTAFCLIRPPGHHAMPDHGMGFCLFNNIAVGARVATNELGIERVLIVDFDVHHGNGTQAMFWDAADVGYYSMHRSPLYPHTGAADEIGAGPGKGTTMNLPVALGTPREEQLETFTASVHAFADKIKPQLVMVSAGFDAHKEDPIGSLGLESEDFRTLTRVLLDVANKHSDGRLVSVLEGGYNAEAMAECVPIHLEQLLEA